MIYSSKFLSLTMLLLSYTLLPACSDRDSTPQQNNVWFKQAQATLEAARKRNIIDRKAKNIIIFIGDGNGVASVTATRILQGQLQGGSGEEHQLAYEQLPHLALVKTYNTNAQTADSAGTASAIFTGIKTKQGVLSINDSVARGDCAAAINNHATTLLELAEQTGRSTGVVTTTRLTHATPAAAYAHSANRDFEDDSKLSSEQKQQGCRDIARQFVEFNYGDGIEVALGGGRRHFLPTSVSDGEGKFGQRQDQLNLIEQWQDKHQDGHFVWNQQGFDKIDPSNTEKLLGLFNSSHMQYELDRQDDLGGEPSLAEMTAKSIDILRKNDEGYFLLVEGGRIDHAHHAGNAARALHDGIAFADAVAAALRKTDPQETLIIVTADHSHTLVMQGYAKRGNPILGLSVGLDQRGEAKTTATLASDGKPYTTLAYINGPGANTKRPRPALSQEQALNKDHRQQASIPMDYETHAGEDVAIYASGPQAHLFDGVVEQNYIFHVIDYAAELGATQ